MDRARQRENRKKKDETYFESRGRNAEGYRDPTASLAIRNIERNEHKTHNRTKVPPFLRQA